MKHRIFPLGLSVKALAATLILLCLAAAGAAWYFFHVTKTPEYSLALIRKSIQNHDVAAFKKHVDLDHILTAGYDDLMFAMVESDKTIKPESKTMVLEFSQLLKTPVVAAFKEEIARYVETGAWAEEAPPSQPADRALPAIDLDKFSSKTGLPNASFLEILSAEGDADPAQRSVKILSGESGAPFTLQLQLRALEDGSWQVAEVLNAREYLMEIAQAKQRALKHYIEATQPIAAAHSQTMAGFSAKMHAIAAATLSDEAKNAALQELWQNEILPEWDRYAEQLNAVEVPSGARELCQLRVKLIQFRRRHIEQQLEFLRTKNPQAETAAKTLNQQASELEYRVGNIVAHILDEG